MDPPAGLARRGIVARDASSLGVVASKSVTARRRSATMRSRCPAPCPFTRAIMPGSGHARRYAIREDGWMRWTALAAGGVALTAALLASGCSGAVPAAGPLSARATTTARPRPSRATCYRGRLLHLRGHCLASACHRPAHPAGLRRPRRPAGQPGDRPRHPDRGRPAAQGSRPSAGGLGQPLSR